MTSFLLLNCHERKFSDTDRSLHENISLTYDCIDKEVNECVALRISCRMKKFYSCKAFFVYYRFTTALHNRINIVFLSCHIRILERIYTL